MDILQSAKGSGFLFSSSTLKDLSYSLRTCFARRVATFLLLLAALLQYSNFASAAVMTHRFTFDIDGRDELAAPKASPYNMKIEGGAVVLSGGIVTFPKGLLDSHTNSYGVPVIGTNLTVELWIQIDADATLLDAAFSLNSVNARFQQDSLAARSSFRELNCPMLPAARTTHVVWTQDGTTRTTRMYFDAELVSEKEDVSPVGIAAKDNSLGRFYGRVYEFRVYQGVLSELEVALNEAAGPGNPSPAPGELNAIKIGAPTTVGAGAMTRFKVLADFENLTNVNVTTLLGLSVSSLTPAVIEPLLVPNESGGVAFMTLSRKLRSHQPGEGRLLAEFRGKTTTADIRVAGITNATLVNRLSFNEPSSSKVAYDSIGTAHGFVPSIARFTGTGQLEFVGSWVTLPAGILSGLGEISVEAWVKPRVSITSSSDLWSRIFDFGDRRDSYGKSYIFMTPSTAPSANVGSTGYYLRASLTPEFNDAESPRLDWDQRLPLNVTSHVAMTYSPLLKTASLYVDGKRVSSDIATHPLACVNDVRNYLGASQFAADPRCQGVFEEFRIFKGILMDTEVAASHLAGPNALPVLSDALEYSLLPPEPAGSGLVNFRVLANPNLKSTKVYFEYGSTNTYGFRTEELDLGMANERKLYTAKASDLPQARGVEQHVRAVFTRDGQTIYTDDLKFLTPRPIRLDRVSNVGTKTATFDGAVAPNEVPTTVRIGVSSDPADAVLVEGGADYTPFTITLTNLLPSTKYSARAVAITATATNYSNPVIVFTTLPVPRIENFTPTNSQVKVQYNSASGLSYDLYASSDLLNWTILTNGMALATGTNTLTGYDPAEPPRFYKLQLK